MMKLPAKAVILSLVGVASCSALLLGQEKPHDRRNWINKDVSTTDDPRRIPIPPALSGPDGTLVLTGGRIFDGTAAAEHSNLPPSLCHLLIRFLTRVIKPPFFGTLAAWSDPCPYRVVLLCRQLISRQVLGIRQKRNVCWERDRDSSVQ